MITWDPPTEEETYPIEFHDCELHEEQEYSCPECGSANVELREYDFGAGEQTGYRDAGDQYYCLECLSHGAAEDAGWKAAPRVVAIRAKAEDEMERALRYGHGDYQEVA